MFEPLFDVLGKLWNDIGCEIWLEILSALNKSKVFNKTQGIQEDHTSNTANGMEMFNENVCHADGAHMLPENVWLS